MTRRKYPKEFLERLKAIKSKRPKTVIDHILKHGFITRGTCRNTATSTRHGLREMCASRVSRSRLFA